MAAPQGIKLLHSIIHVYRKRLKKSSSQELQHQIGQYLTWSFPRTGRFNFIEMKFLGLQMAPPWALNFYIVIYRAMFKQSSSKEQQHQIGQ